MKFFSRVSLVFVAVLFIGAVSAKADSLLYFTVTGPGKTASFELPTHPVINPYNADPGFGFLVTPINLIIDGVASYDFLGFYADGPLGGGGGVASFTSVFSTHFSLFGPQLYSGDEFNPVFAAQGPTTFFDVDNSDQYSLTISQNASTVPEPTTLLLLAAGLLPLGLLVKRLA
jgi:hypothetical protein